MEKTNTFDSVMNFIDEHVKSSYSEIKRGIYATSNFSDLDFSKFLSVLTGGKITLNDYFKNRKLYFASQELVDLPEKTIVDIALDYGYSEQSAFSRAIKNQYGYTPNEIRKHGMKFIDEKMCFADFNPKDNEYGKRLHDAISSVLDESEEGWIYEDHDYFEDFIFATEEYGFDTTTCYAISEISERIGVPFGVLLNVCFETMMDFRSCDNYIEPRIEKAMDCGITSDEELEKMCDYYNCEYYQLNRFMVDEYRKRN